MAKTKREFIIATFVISAIATIVSLVSLGTEQWVVSQPRYTLPSLTSANKVTYGLFSGNLHKNIAGNVAVYKIEMTCAMGENKCAMLCGQTSDSRDQQLKALLNKQNISFDTNCPKIARMWGVPHFKINPKTDPEAYSNYRFINAGIWVSSIFFLVVSAGFGLLTAILSIWNTVDNPVNPYLNILGLYIYNGVAACCSLLTTILWGGHYLGTINRNVGVLETITNDMTSNGLTHLGYSYWIIFISWIFHFCNICVLYTRQYLVNKEPTSKIHYEETTDAGLIIY